MDGGAQRDTGVDADRAKARRAGRRLSWPAVQRRRTGAECTAALQRGPQPTSTERVARPGGRQALPRFTALGIGPGLAEDAKISYLTINALAKLLWYRRESGAGRPPRGSCSFRQSSASCPSPLPSSVAP